LPPKIKPEFSRDIIKSCSPRWTRRKFGGGQGPSQGLFNPGHL